jgi:3-oxoacyl-[acyl-carrier protein] reductase
MPDALFVSGGSRGIGRALVLAAAEAGYDVAFTYRTREDEAASLLDEVSRTAPDRKVCAFALDVRDSDAVDRVADAALEALGRIDAVVANAGVSVNGLAYSLTDEDWSTVLDTNLTGAFRVCRALLPELVARRRGRIVLMSSVSAGGATGQAAYAASKAGLVGLGQALAKEYGAKGVTTNIVAPGYFDTDMTRETMDAERTGFAMKFCPLRRFGQLDELTSTVLFLLSPGAGFINGTVIRVTGGLDWAL